MRKLANQINVNNSDPNFPFGRIRNNTGTGNGTPVNESVYGDIHVNIAKKMALYGIEGNDLPDNEVYGYQIIEAERALATKNDFILPLSLNSGVLSVPIKIGFMLENESVICKAGFGLTTETQIKGSDNVTLSFTANGSFKTNEYVRLIKNATTVTLVRIADQASLDAMATELLFLKKASQAEENAGSIDTKATTPLSNLTAFIKRVIGTDSVSYLATAIRNGLYPKEHFAIVAGLAGIKNKGSVAGINIGSGSSSLTVTGNFTSASIANSGLESDTSIVTVVMANAMANTNYNVRLYPISEGVLENDLDFYSYIPKIVDTTTFKIGLSQITSATSQNIKFHIEVEQL